MGLPHAPVKNRKEKKNIWNYPSYRKIASLLVMLAEHNLRNYTLAQVAKLHSKKASYI
jgi:hypothetical protein